MATHPDWEIAGTYLEACNCEAICPCRNVGGRRGGRSTYGICTGALSWLVEEGHLGDVDLSGLAAVIACHYDDDEPGSPWSFFLYVDARGDEDQRAALVGILSGARGGTARAHFPWAWKPSRFLGWRAVEIAIDHTPGRGWFRAGGNVEVRLGAPVAGQEAVTCGIPGHDHEGIEYVADLLQIEEGPLEVELRGRCAFETTFRYASVPP